MVAGQVTGLRRWPCDGTGRETMLKWDGVLNEGQIAEVRRIVGAAKFVYGSASGNATPKHNLQADCSTKEFDTAIRTVAGALMAREVFKIYALPKQITLEFNGYDPGMFWRAHG
jgi:predicted 2-oxoglutarate/Fe(II)-dependent dioxygenase YbiX